MNDQPSNLRNFKNKLLEPVDITFLTVFRMLFGVIMCWEMWRYISKGWIDNKWIEPDFFFTFYGFSWVQPWPGMGMHVHCAALGVLAIFIAFGFMYRTSTILFFLGFTYLFLLDQSIYLNHFYLICLYSFLIIFLPANQASSIDCRLNPSIRSDTTPRWVLWLLRFQIGVVYVYGGIAKINGDWLQGQPMGMWLSSDTDFPYVGRFFEDEWMIYAFSYGGLLLDLFIVPFLMWKRTRWYALGTIVLFHLMNANLFSIGVFPFLAIAVTTVYLEPDWLKRLFEIKPTLQPQRATSLPSPPIWVTAVLVVFVAIQLLMPLRHWLYSGNPHWTEEGHRFSWRMKLRDKDADTTFYVVNPATNERTMVDAREYLTSKQIGKMSKTPDMILQFAHHLADRWESDYGVENAEVYVEAYVSLNGRTPQLLVKRDVDLAAERRTLRESDWITRLQNPLKLTQR